MTVQKRHWPSLEQGSVILLGLVTIFSGVFVLGKWILAAPQGFEFSDEGYYFLILQDPWRNLGSSFFGFFLHPWYQISGKDPGNYRLLGLGVLLGLGWILSRAFIANVGIVKSSWRWAARAAIISGAVLVFSNGQRTAAYNYLVLLGSLVCWTGYLSILNSGQAKRIPWLILGLGLGLVALAKWSCLAPFTAIFILLTRPWNNLPARWGWGWAFSAFLGLIVSVLLYAGREGILGIFRQVQLLVETLSTHGLGLLIYYIPTLVNFVYRALRAFAYGLPLLALLFWLQRSQKTRTRIRAWAWLLPWLLLGGGFFFGLAKGGISSFSRVGSNVLAEQLWLMAAFFVISRGHAWLALRSYREPILGLLATPFALGIGTASALGDYTGHGAVFFQLAGLFIWKASVDKGLPFPLVNSFLCVAAILNLGRINNALNDPYRSEIPSLCTVEWKVPGSGKIFLDPSRAKVAQAAYQALGAAGFQPGAALIAIGNLPGLVYLVGGWSPGTVWFYDTHKNSKEFTLRALDAISEEERRSSWVIFRENSMLFADKKEVLLSLQRTDISPYTTEPVSLEGETTRLWIWPPQVSAQVPSR